jgi:hypothetical protein
VGGGWKKTFKMFPIKIFTSQPKFGSASLSDLSKYFKGLPIKRKINRDKALNE